MKFLKALSLFAFFGFLNNAYAQSIAIFGHNKNEMVGYSANGTFVQLKTIEYDVPRNNNGETANVVVIASGKITGSPSGKAQFRLVVQDLGGNTLEEKTASHNCHEGNVDHEYYSPGSYDFSGTVYKECRNMDFALTLPAQLPVGQKVRIQLQWNEAVTPPQGTSRLSFYLHSITLIGADERLARVIQ